MTTNSYKNALAGLLGSHGILGNSSKTITSDVQAMISNINELGKRVEQLKSIKPTEAVEKASRVLNECAKDVKASIYPQQQVQSVLASDLENDQPEASTGPRV